MIMRFELKVHYTFVCILFFNLRIRQENVNVSSDGTPTETSVDENVKLDRCNESR